MSTLYKTFETERLFLRPTNNEDAEFIFQLMDTPKWKKFIGDRNVNSAVDAADYIENKMQAQLKRLGYSNYTVIRKSDNLKIGTCGLYDREGLEGVDLGFAFLPEYESQGYGFETANRIKDAALNEFNLQIINAITLPENIISQKLIEKLGFRFIEMVTIPTDDDELMLYQLINKEQTS